MQNKRRKLRVLAIVLTLASYIAVVIAGLTESRRRSLALREDVDTSDRVLVSIVVTNANPTTQKLTAQLAFQLTGRIAKDSVTPAVDLKLLINNVGGQEEFTFLKGERMNRIEAIFPLNGNLNEYPFDRYETTLWLLMTTPVQNMRPQASKKRAPTTKHDFDELAVSSSEMQQNAPVALSTSTSASIPGIRFEGDVSQGNTQEPIRIALHLTRANNVITVSLIVMLMMAALSLSLLAMVISAITVGDKSDLFPLSISIPLIFGLPALRDIQPGVPPVGAFVDYVVFVWAELIVAASAVIVVWTWLLRARSKS